MQRKKLLFIIISITLISMLSYGLKLNDVESGVVKIKSTDFEGNKRVGSGFVVNKEGSKIYIMTISHVIEGDPQPQVEFVTNKGETYESKILYRQTEGDGPALLVVDGRGLKGITTIQFNSDKGPEKNDPVVIIGSPRKAGADNIVTYGAVAGFKDIQMILSGTFNEGNSGGPVFDKDFKLVGMVTSMSDYGYALKSDYLKLVLEGWKIDMSEAKLMKEFVDDKRGDLKHILYKTHIEELVINTDGTFTGVNNDGALFFLDKKRELIRTNHYNNKNRSDTKFIWLGQTGDNNIISVAQSLNARTKQPFLLLLLLDKDGNVIEEKEYPFRGKFEINEIQILPDDSLIMLVNFKNFIKITKAGVEAFNTELEISNRVKSPESRYICSLTNGNFLVLKEYEKKQLSKDDNRFYIRYYVIDKKGRISKTNEHEGTSGRNESFMCVSQMFPLPKGAYHMIYLILNKGLISARFDARHKKVDEIVHNEYKYLRPSRIIQKDGDLYVFSKGSINKKSAFFLCKWAGKKEMVEWIYDFYHDYNRQEILIEKRLIARNTGDSIENILTTGSGDFILYGNNQITFRTSNDEFYEIQSVGWMMQVDKTGSPIK